MLCVVVVIALLGLGATGAVELPDTYAQKLREVVQADHLLARRLNSTKADYDLFKPLVHYLSLLGLAYYPAKELSLGKSKQSALQLVEHSLSSHLPDLLLSPENAVKELKVVLDLTRDQLKPLSDLVTMVCKDLNDFECNKVVNKLLLTGQYGDVKKSTLVLNHAYPVATLVLAKEKRLNEVAEGFDVIPYLVGNKLDVVELVKLLSKLLVQVNLK